MATSISTSPIFTAMERDSVSTYSAPQSTPRKYNGLFLVHSSAPKQDAPKQNTQAIADSIVAEIERDLERARNKRIVLARFEAQRETPLLVARRIVKNLFGLMRTA